MKTKILIATSFFAATFLFGLAIGLSFPSGWRLSIGETTSLFIAASAMIATCYQAWLSRRHNKLQVKPLIMLEYPIEANPTTDGSHLIACQLHNIGLGPANVSNLKLTLNAKAINTQELEDAFWQRTGIEELYQQNKINCVSKSIQNINGFYLQANQELTIFSIKFWPESNDYTATSKELSDAYKLASKLALEDLRIQAEYSSVYEEKPLIIDSHKYKISMQSI
jgi:hypothetical protein